MELLDELGKNWRYIGVLNGKAFQRNKQIYEKSDMIRSVATALYGFVVSEAMPDFQLGCVPDEKCKFDERRMTEHFRSVFYEYWHDLQMPVIRDVIIGGLVVYVTRKSSKNGEKVPIIVTEFWGLLFDIHVYIHTKKNQIRYMVYQTQLSKRNTHDINFKNSTVVIDPAFAPSLSTGELTSIISWLAPRHDFMRTQELYNTRATILSADPTVFLRSDADIKDHLALYQRHFEEGGNLPTLLNYQLHRGNVSSFEEDITDMSYRIYDKIRNFGVNALSSMQNAFTAPSFEIEDDITSSNIQRPAKYSLELTPLGTALDGQLQATYFNNWQQLHYVHANVIATAFGVPNSLISSLTYAAIARTGMSDTNLVVFVKTINNWRRTIGRVMSDMCNNIYTADSEDGKQRIFVRYPDFEFQVPTDNKRKQEDGSSVPRKKTKKNPDEESKKAGNEEKPKKKKEEEKPEKKEEKFEEEKEKPEKKSEEEKEKSEKKEEKSEKKDKEEKKKEKKKAKNKRK